MKNVFRFAALLVLSVTLASGAFAQRVLKLNESLGPGSVEEAALLHFKKLVEDGSKGEIQIQIFLQDALGNPQSSLENLLTGSLDLYSGALEYYAQIVPQELAAASTPYLLPNQEALRRYLRGPVFKVAEKKLLDKGIRVISTEYNGDRGPYRVIVSSKAIRTVDDVNGLKLRVFPNDVYVRAWKALGATTVQVAFGEVYLGIRQGVVQSVTTGIQGVRPMKFTEVAPFVTEIKEYAQTWPMTISERTWQKLSPAHQQLLVRSANEAGKVYAKISEDRVQGDKDFMRTNHMAEFITIDTAPFRKKLEPFYESLVKEKLMTQEIYDEILKLNK
jgi:TRAP-type C4-dicarboxylate transport system substrate-binding protein